MSAASVQLLFPPTLTARQRAALHAVGNTHDLPHESTGEGAERRIRLGAADSKAVEVPCALRISS